MTKPLKTKQTNRVSCSDFDALVKDVYKRPYEFQQQDNCKDRGVEHVTVPVRSPYDYPNATVPEKINGNEMGVSFAAWLARDPSEWKGANDDSSYINMFWERNFYPYLDMVINDLYAKGLIEAGDYTIEIDW